MKILNRIYLVLGILLGIAGVVQCVRWTSSSGTITAGYLFNFAPAAAFFLAYIAGRKLPRKVTHIVAIPTCIIALACGIFVALGVEMFISATTEVTDTAKYEQILNDYWNSYEGLIAHFPRPIPSKARDIKFSFLPAFMQGGAHIQLRHSLPADAISELYNHYSEKKTKSFIGGDTNDHMNMKEGMPTKFFYTSDSENHEFPDDFEIMIFDEVLREDDRPEGHYWNHGQSHGVAISKTRNQIVYWAESW